MVDIKVAVGMIGTNVQVRFESVLVTCKVMNARQAWGRVDVEVTPVQGLFFQWVSIDRVSDGDPTNIALAAA